MFLKAETGRSPSKESTLNNIKKEGNYETLSFNFFVFPLWNFVQSILFAQQDTLQFICSFSSNDSSYTDGPGVTPLIDTTEMAIILCAEKNQPKEVSIQLLLKNFKTIHTGLF